LPSKKLSTETTVELYKFEADYLAQCPLNIYEIAREIVTHFQLYFIKGDVPGIIIRNQNTIEVNLSNLFKNEFAKDVLTSSFKIGDKPFDVIISKSEKAKSHKFLYCAHGRVVKDEGISKYIEDLRFKIGTDAGQPFFYQVFVVGPYLDENVNGERTNFDFKSEDDESDLDFPEISLAKIRKETIHCVEELLSEFFISARREKLDGYYPTIANEYPNYLSVINYNKSKVEKLPVGLSNAELDIKLYEIESQWRINVKKEGVELLDKKKDITSLDEYKSLYQKFLTEFNEIGQSDLTRYVIHRRSVIDLLDKLIHLNDENKFSNEDIVHSLFFPIRESKEAIMHEKQNLWLVDERLTFNSLLASDQLFKKVKPLSSG
jgi:hypothetical protein